eukprot:maker-scaffold876_size86062-snap-gene-0.27 protein:Tk10532 transcript:maker-scaffold876_size86062-snap-gene-0.27-mRNA-1 annotation:"hypothetical protein Phum_PHUM372080"
MEPLLYEIVVFQEWARAGGSAGGLSGQAPSGSWASLKRAWGSLRPWFVSERAQLLAGWRAWRRVGRPRWKLAVRPDCLQWAVVREEEIELHDQLVARGSPGRVGGFQLAQRQAWPADPSGQPRLRVARWSPDQQYLLLAQGDGSLLAYEPRAQALHALSPDDPGAPAAGPVLHLASLSAASDLWVAVHESGLVRLVALDGRGLSLLQAHVWPSSRFPHGLTDACVDAARGLVYVCGPARGPHSPWACLRLLDQRQLDEFILSPPASPELAPHAFPYQVALSHDGTRLASIYSDNSLVILQLPSLQVSQVLSVWDQACHDEVNPASVAQVLDAVSAVSARDPGAALLEWVSALQWWSDEVVAVLRLTGSFTLLSLADGSNVLGPLPEFFSAAVEMPSRQDNGFLLIEEGHCPHPVTQMESVKVLYFQSSSPMELFLRKIGEGDFGEAIILARHYHLDTDLVHLEQWRQSSFDHHAIVDCLEKVKSVESKIAQALTAVPDQLEDMEALLRYGIHWAHSSECEPAQRILADYLAKFHLFEKVGRDAQAAIPFQDFRLQSCLELAVHFAGEGALEALHVICLEHWTDEIDGQIDTILPEIPEAVTTEELEGFISFLQARGVALTGWMTGRIQTCVRLGYPGNALSLIKTCGRHSIHIPPHLETTMACFETVMKRFGVELLSFDEMDQMSVPELIRVIVQNMDEVHMEREVREVLGPILCQVSSMRGPSSSALTEDLNLVMAHLMPGRPERVLQVLSIMFGMINSETTETKGTTITNTTPTLLPCTRANLEEICCGLVPHFKLEPRFLQPLLELKMLLEAMISPANTQLIESCLRHLTCLEVMIERGFVSEQEPVHLPLASPELAAFLDCWTRNLESDILLDQAETLLYIRPQIAPQLENAVCIRVFLTRFASQALAGTIDKLVHLKDSREFAVLSQKWNLNLRESEDWASIAVTACETHFKHSPTCQSPSIGSARSCLKLAKPVTCARWVMWEHVLAICEVVRTRGFVTLVMPKQILANCLSPTKSPKPFLEHLCQHVDLTEKSLDPLLEIGDHLVQAGGALSKDHVQGILLESFTRRAFKSGHSDLALSLVRKMVKHKHTESAMLCSDVAKDHLQRTKRKRTPSLDLLTIFSFALNWAPPEEIVRMAHQLTSYTMDRKWESASAQWPVYLSEFSVQSPHSESMPRMGRRFADLYRSTLLDVYDQGCDSQAPDLHRLLEFSLSQLDQSRQTVAGEIIDRVSTSVGPTASEHEKIASSDCEPDTIELSGMMDDEPTMDEEAPTRDLVLAPSSEPIPSSMLTLAAKLYYRRVHPALK